MADKKDDGKVEPKKEFFAPATDEHEPEPVAPEPEPVKVPKLRKYVVTAGAGVCPLGNGRKAKEAYGERARIYRDGEVVELTSSEAKHYVKLGRLDPYIDDDED